MFGLTNWKPPFKKQFKKPRGTVLIVGGGPAGLEAALYGALLGFEVNVFEKDRVLEQWHTFQDLEYLPSKLFSPLLKRIKDFPMPGENRITGAKYQALYQWAADQSPLKNRVFPGHLVVAAGRRGIGRKDWIKDPQRLKYPFRLIVQTPTGEETPYHGHYLLDCSGLAADNPIGGGVQAPGETSVQKRILKGVQNFNTAQKKEFIGRHILMVGGGLSAAANLVTLRELMEQDANTRVTLLVLNNRNNPFDFKNVLRGQEILREAHRIVEEAHISLKFLNNASVEMVDYFFEKNRFKVQVMAGGEPVLLEPDKIINCSGHHPDYQWLSELNVNPPFPHQAVGSIPAQLANGAEEIKLTMQEMVQPEPGFFICGGKTFGRFPGYQPRFGWDQIATLYQILLKDPTCNLYQDRLGAQGSEPESPMRFQIKTAGLRK